MTDVALTVDAGRRADDLLGSETAANLSGSDRSMVSPSVDAPPPSTGAGPGRLTAADSQPRADHAPGAASPTPGAAGPIEAAVGAGVSPVDLLRAVAEASPFPVLVCRKHDAVIVQCNARLGELLGTCPSELVGRRTFELFDDVSARETSQRELARDGRLGQREVRWRARGGCVWAAVSLEPLKLPEPAPSPPGTRPELLFGTLHDVTSTREAEDRLRQSEARFRGFVECSNDLVFAVDRQGSITYLSPNVSRLLGHQPSQFVGKAFDALAYGCDVAKLWESTGLASDAPGAGQPPPAQTRRHELRLLRSDGSARWFCASVESIRDGAGEVVGLSGTAHDITLEKAALADLERAHESLRDAQLQLVRTEKMASLGLLMAGIAHEIRTPLGAVSNTQRTISTALDKLGERLHEAFPEALEDSKLGRLLKVLTDSTRVVGDGSTRMTDIVQRLRKFSCADEAKLCSVDVNAIADDTLALIHHELKHYVAIQRCYGEGVTLMGYPARLNQVLVNLLVNAAQAVRARGNGKITLETRAVGDHIEISVSDDGVGIPPENLGQIFACGFTTRHQEGGSGLGLAISKEIVDAHHGSLEVRSQLGAGTTFTVRLPRSLSDCRKPNRGCRF
ncbi:MAG TPA: ATP-binding protein [Polyangiaceae bacterium]|nr:ATP-binding protein [Polyangiaceae bacterium]